MQTKEIVEKYYDGIAQKKGWESVISDEISFSEPDQRPPGKPLMSREPADFYDPLKARR